MTGSVVAAPAAPGLRVAVIAPPWVSVPPVGYGGTESVIDTLCRGLVAAGHQVLLVASGDSTCPVERASFFPEALGIGASNGLADIEHAAFGYEAASRWGADIAHDHTLAGPSLGGLVAPMPVVTTCHGPFNSELGVVYRLLSRRVPVIAISRSQASESRGITVATVIHHGVDLDQYPTASTGGDYLLFVGRMSPEKGIDVAIDVATRAGTRLVIAAKMREPLEHRYFEEVVRPKLGSGVDYIGEVERSVQIDLLRNAMCLINPIQWSEPFGLVAIEAMAAGTPVVTTPRGAMPEIVVDGLTGFIRDSVDGLAEAVGKVPLLDRAAARRHVTEHFSMERMTANHVRFYSHVLETRCGAT